MPVHPGAGLPIIVLRDSARYVVRRCEPAPTLVAQEAGTRPQIGSNALVQCHR